MDDDIAAAIPEDVSEGKVLRNLHIAVVPPLAHSEEYSIDEGVRVVSVCPAPGHHTRVLSAGVDYAHVRALLARCERAHMPAVSSDVEVEDAEVVDPPLDLVLPELLVIDCGSERLVRAGAGCRFAALSYVWGRSRDEGQHKGDDDDDDEEQFQFDLGKRSRPLPRTVLDAMHVVRELGLRFLWVDRYCIQDSDGDDVAAPGGRKHHTIENMDAIYRGAALTIVAASGAHSEHGLPGSRRIHRRLGTYSLDESSSETCYLHINEAHAEVSELVWSTRGWTYQEGLLSRHRLVFTETQAVFQCCHHPQQRSDNTNNSRIARAGDVFYRIEEYTRRRLTYPTDSLRAFLGVLRAFEKLRPPAEHLWGVPFVFGTDGRVRQLAQGLLWKSQSCSLRRIVGIPSWSWAGWAGWASQQQRQPNGEEEDSGTDHSVWMYGLLPVDPSLADLDDILIEVPSGEGRVVGLAEYFRTQREGRGRGRRGLPSEHAIYVTAWTTEISFYPGRRREYVLDLDTRSDFGLSLGPITTAAAGEQIENGETMTVAVICWGLRHSTSASRAFRTQSLVLAPAGADSFCRAGTLETRWRRQQLQEDGNGGAYIATWDRHFVRRRLRLV